MATTTQSTNPAGHRKGFLHRFRPRINKDKLLLRQYGLTKWERIQMFIWGICLSTGIAVPIGSAAYYLITQQRYMTQSPGGQPFTVFYLKDTWDQLPNHVANLFHAAWFHGSQIAPAWWVTARHDTRHIGIIFSGILLMGAFLVVVKPGREPEPLSGKQMAKAVVKAFFAALITGAVMILFVTKVVHQLANVGLVTGTPYLSELLGKGTLQLTLIAIPPGIVAKKILHRTFATLQLTSIEDNLPHGLSKRRRRIYPPNYRKRYALYQSKANGHRLTKAHGKGLAFAAVLTALILFALFVFGIYLLYFGPAAHAH